jgi:peptidoglycan biosynthesis protein MviN/MurJ (putative lipid II flippase)
LAAASLAVFVIGLVAQSLVHLFVRGYYAAGNTKKPLIVNFAGELITIVLAFVFIFLFDHVSVFSQFFVHVLRLDGVANITLLALPLAFALGNIVNYFLLLWVFRVDFPEACDYSIFSTTTQTLAASLVMGLSTYGILNILPSIIRQETFSGILLQGLLAGTIGIIVFGIIMILLKNEEMLEFKKTIQRKFWKADIVIDQSSLDT